jgi:hypothetical protein
VSGRTGSRLRLKRPRLRLRLKLKRLRLKRLRLKIGFKQLVTVERTLQPYDVLRARLKSLRRLPVPLQVPLPLPLPVPLQVQLLLRVFPKSLVARLDAGRMLVLGSKLSVMRRRRIMRKI